MIKRRFYKHEHDDKNDPSDSSSSSSSDSELEAEDVEESEDEAVTGVEENVESQQSEDDAVAEAKEDAESEESDDDAAAEAKVDAESCSTSSGYQSEDSLAHEVDADSSGELVNEDDEETMERDSVLVDVPPYILQHKKVYRCRICPRVVCLSQDFLTAHLNSKKHARAEKLLNEGRLKSILNDNLEVENQETPAELHARIVALAQSNPKNKNKGRQRQKKRQREKSSRKKSEDDSNVDKAGISTKGRAKKRRKSEK